MKAYKATKKLKCKSITYEEGKTYTLHGELKMCQQGFHFCKNPKDTLNYCFFDKDFVLMEIEVLGEIITKDDKSVTNKFKVNKVLSRQETNELLGFIEECDAKNNLIHSKNSDGSENWNEYDAKNNLIHSKNSDGSENWNEYDAKNNLIHYKDSRGYEYWNEYDANNNLVHYKNSRGYEYWKEYDEKNNLVHYKNSDGSENWNEYDAKNNLIHSKNSRGEEWEIKID